MGGFVVQNHIFVHLVPIEFGRAKIEADPGLKR
jgi:hypothetical protein